LIESHKKDIKRMEMEKEDAIKEKDEETRKELEEEMERLRNQITRQEDGFGDYVVEI
jgi:hypothetical protein